uniref:GSTe1 n=1 Tax=Paracoccus marginatus TaxID=252483 RepID=A0AA51N372_9HEMI|nr:GSTe1 [Paracoccus marginatus]
MVLKLYYNINASPCRAVLYTLNALNVPYEIVDISLLHHEQKTEKFRKMNPQHTIPTIEDEDGFILWDSHAINAYLAAKYGKDEHDKLYPKDLKARAIVDQTLHFNNSVLFASLLNNIKTIIVRESITKITPVLKESVEEAFDFLEKFLADGRRFVAGNDITIADFSITTTITNLTVFMPLVLKGYPLVSEYYKRNEAFIPGFQEIEAEVKISVGEILSSLNYEFDE